ncbi:MAG: carbohydrate-binding family 9-like protein [Bradymonadales bacterium]|nr:carbohydrate-binding family 9-like protein [Bradymonadales bacterium]
MDRRRDVSLSVAVLLVAAGLALGCQKISEPIPLLTQDQRQRIQEQLLTEVPQVGHPIGAVFGDQVELVGYDIEPEVVEIGSSFTITWTWRVLARVEDRWEIFVHLDSGSQRQNLDHEMVGGLYTSLYWREGDIIRDQQTVDLAAHMGTGTVNIYLGLWRRVDGARMEIANPGQGTTDPTGRLHVGSFESRIHLVRYEVSPLQGELTIDGSLREPHWRRAENTSAFIHPNDGSEMRGIRTQARMLWDEQYLYIGITAQDQDIWSTIAQRDGDLWEEEVLEVYLDPRGDGRNYVEIQINPLGTVFDAIFDRAANRDLAAARARNIEGLQAAVEVNGTLNQRDDRDRRWSAEFAIPWRSLPDFGPRARGGEILRGNFYRYDRTADGETLTAAWSPVFGGSFHQPDKFGEIVLVNGSGQPDETASGSEQTGSVQGQQESPSVRPTIRENPATGATCGGGRRTLTTLRPGVAEGTGAERGRRITLDRIRSREQPVPLEVIPAGTAPATP